MEMDYDLFKMIHSELIMSVQYIEQDLRIIYSTIKHGNYEDNYALVDSAPLGKLLKELHEVDEALGYSKIKEKDYELLDQIREIRNYWCHQCYLDFHYEEDPIKHEQKFKAVADRLRLDELKVYDLYEKIEKLRKSVVRKYKHRK
ncbi:MAG: hypothetical protein K6A90_10540 [Lachnospiraceae bacterium]|nr:hypothetical protein [Lachnospiraceae bacterium]